MRLKHAYNTTKIVDVFLYLLKTTCILDYNYRFVLDGMQYIKEITTGTYYTKELSMTIL